GKHQPARLLFHALLQRRAWPLAERRGARLKRGDLDAVGRLAVRPLEIDEVTASIDHRNRSFEVVRGCGFPRRLGHPVSVRERHLRFAAHLIISVDPAWVYRPRPPLSKEGSSGAGSCSIA